MKNALWSITRAAAETNGDKFIWLIHGVPLRPPYYMRWVSFMNPDRSWWKMWYKESHAFDMVYMPTWTLGELYEAATVLDRSEPLETIDESENQVFQLDGLPVDKFVHQPTVLAYRFAAFGGIVRVCFECPAVVKNEFCALVQTIDEVTLEALFRAHFEMDVMPEYVRKMLHYVALGYNKKEIQMGSVIIKLSPHTA